MQNTLNTYEIITFQLLHLLHISKVVLAICDLWPLNKQSQIRQAIKEPLTKVCSNGVLLTVSIW